MPWLLPCGPLLPSTNRKLSKKLDSKTEKSSLADEVAVVVACYCCESLLNSWMRSTFMAGAS